MRQNFPQPSTRKINVVEITQLLQQHIPRDCKFALIVMNDDDSGPTEYSESFYVCPPWPGPERVRGLLAINSLSNNSFRGWAIQEFRNLLERESSDIKIVPLDGDMS